MFYFVLHLARRITKNSTTIMDLEKLFNDKLNALVNDGYLEQTVEKSTKKLIDDVIGGFFASYSDFGNALRKHIEKNLTINLKEVSLDQYSVIVNNIIQDHLLNYSASFIAPKVKEEIDRTFGVLEKQEWYLSEIMERFKDEYRSQELHECTCIVEESQYGSIFVYFDEEADKGKYSCGGQFCISVEGEEEKGKIWRFEHKEKYVRGSVKSSDPERPIGSDFDKFLFKLYAQGATIIIDDVNTEYYDY
jgi:hypothetical protein